MALKKMDTLVIKITDILTIVMMFLLVFMVSFQVLNRFILHWPAAWTEEMARYNFVWVSLLGAVSALHYRRQLSVDILTENIKSPKIKRMLGIVAALFVLLFSFILTRTGWQYTKANFNVNCEFGAFPLGIIYAILPITGLLLIYVSVKQLIEEFRKAPR
jgi:TRAP-type C4-dicarboxylate transport system permease small subunit